MATTKCLWWLKLVNGHEKMSLVKLANHSNTISANVIGESRTLPVQNCRENVS